MSAVLEGKSTDQLVRYDAMVLAIADCHRVDEVKDLRDKAKALAEYHRQASNKEAERQACEIRIRAEIRAGEILHQMAKDGERATRGGDRDSNVVSRDIRNAPTLSDLGISRDQASKWMQLASVPKQKLEEALRGTRPTTIGILRASAEESAPKKYPPMRAVNGATRMDDDSLWIWGTLRDFESGKILRRSPADLYGGMTENMQEDMQRLLPEILDWLQRLEKEFSNG